MLCNIGRRRSKFVQALTHESVDLHNVYAFIQCTSFVLKVTLRQIMREIGGEGGREGRGEGRGLKVYGGRNSPDLI